MKNQFWNILAILAIAGAAAPASADYLLGTASNFPVLGASTLTNIGPTVLSGDLGVWPGNALTGFPPGVVAGTICAGDAVDRLQ